MAEGTLFAELIKNLDQFDRKLIFVLPKLSGFEAEPHFMIQNILLKQQF